MTVTDSGGFRLPNETIAYWILVAAITVAVGSLFAALLLRGEGSAKSQDANVSLTVAASSTKPVRTVKATLDSTCEIPQVPLLNEKSERLERQRQPVIQAPPAEDLPFVPSAQELWEARGVAVRRSVAYASQSLTALQVIEADVTERIWDYLDDRPKFLATGCADGQGRIFEFGADRPLVTLRHDFSAKDQIRSVNFERRWPLLLTTTWDGKMHTWDKWPTHPARASEVVRGEKGIGHENKVTATAFSRDGSKLVCACSLGRVLIYRFNCSTLEVEITTPEEIELLRDTLKMGDFSELYLTSDIEIAGMHLEENLCLLKECGFEGLCTRRDLGGVSLPTILRFRFNGCMTRGHQKAWRSLMHNEAVLALAVVAEGCKEFIYSGSRDKTVVKWDLSDGSPVHVYKGHLSMVSCLSVNSRFLATGSDDRSLRIWRKEQPEFIRSLDAHTDFVLAVALCPTFPELLASSARDVRVLLWNVATGELLREFVHNVEPLAVCIRGAFLFTAGCDRYLRCWLMERNVCASRVRHPGGVTALSVQ